MSVKYVHTLIVGAGQAGLAMSEHLTARGLQHQLLERDRLVESWRSRRWDSLVANGPAWHDRFPNMTFDQVDPDGFATKEQIVGYFEAYARQIDAPVHTGIEVTGITQHADKAGFRVETSGEVIEAANVVVATGPFQSPKMPSWVPATQGIDQMHSNEYRNPSQLRQGGVLVVGAGSSGVQIADELLRSGREVYLAVGPHNRPPRRYRGRDFCWWLGVLGKWDVKTPDLGAKHVTIAVSGARGGHTVDFRDLGSRGMILVGRAEGFAAGKMHFAPDLARNIEAGDADYLSVLDEADAYVVRERLDMPADPEARALGADPECLTNPILELDLVQAGITTIIWATGYAPNFRWLDVDTFDEHGRPIHHDGVSVVPGLYFLGLPWLSSRSSAFIWGVWRDANFLAEHIAARFGDAASQGALAVTTQMQDAAAGGSNS